MTVWALDMDGVIWTGSNPVPGSAEAIGRLRSEGHEVVFVTNNSYSSVDDHRRKLASFGIEGGDGIVSSAQAAAALVQPGERVFVLGGPGVTEAVEARGSILVGPDDPTADAVIVGLDWELTYHKVAAAAAHVRGGARFVGTNADPSFPSTGGLMPGAGAIVASVAVASGQEPQYGGKPHPPVAKMVRDRFGADGIMVGDRPETDGLFAKVLGYRFGLVFSGVTAPDDLPVRPNPDLTAPDLAALVAAELA